MNESETVVVWVPTQNIFLKIASRVIDSQTANDSQSAVFHFRKFQDNSTLNSTTMMLGNFKDSYIFVSILSKIYVFSVCVSDYFFSRSSYCNISMVIKLTELWWQIIFITVFSSVRIYQLSIALPSTVVSKRTQVFGSTCWKDQVSINIKGTHLLDFSDVLTMLNALNLGNHAKWHVISDCPWNLCVWWWEQEIQQSNELSVNEVTGFWGYCIKFCSSITNFWLPVFHF